jgi:hypothetical protein
MSLGALDPTAISIGNDAGYLLGFHTETVTGRAHTIVEEPVIELGRDDYEGDVRASLVGGLEPGTFTFTLEGITDAHYKKIAQTGAGHPTVIKLYLYWRDTTSSAGSYLASMAGLDSVMKLKGADIPGGPVAVLSIVSVTRKVGERSYQAEITAHEWVYDRLAVPPCEPGSNATTPSAAVTALVQPVLGDPSYVDPTPHPMTPPPQPATPGDDSIQIEQRKTVVDQLKHIAELLEQRSGRYGRGMLLIRKGELHVGLRPIPLAGSAKQLTVAGGLIEPLVTGTVVSDPTHDPCHPPMPTRRQLQITLRGRPDLRPGDTVQINLPTEDLTTAGGGLFGAIGDLVAGPLLPAMPDALTDPKTTVYVTGVEHRLGRSSGFATTVTGVELVDGSDPWDGRENPHGLDEAATKAAHPNAETDASQAVAARIESANSLRSSIEVGEVRQTTTSGTAEPPSQTVLVWQGLAPADGQVGQSRRLEVSRPSPAPRPGVPYATPWAWGKCGLVLPRYPGTRVVLAHRQGRQNDPIDIGALWESGHGPDSDPGDWWLILPVGAENPQTIADSDIPTEHTGNAVNDLTDKDGHRIIELGELTVRVGSGSLSSAGTRPARAGDEGSITIEHADGGASIVIKKDGSIVIHAAKDLELKSDQDIKLDANNVRVTVSGTMDVS